MKGRKGPKRDLETLTTATRARNNITPKNIRIGILGVEYKDKIEKLGKRFMLARREGFKGIKITKNNKNVIIKLMNILFACMNWFG